MIAHLVGGPANGRELPLRGEFPSPVIEVPAPIKPVVNWWNGEDTIPPCSNFDTDSYRLIKSNRRIAIYEWVPPKITASFAFTILPGLDQELLYRKVRDLSSLEGEIVRVTNVLYDGHSATVTGSVLVDGPADATAAEEATAAVKQLIERKLRFYRIAGFALDLTE